MRVNKKDMKRLAYYLEILSSDLDLTDVETVDLMGYLSRTYLTGKGKTLDNVCYIMMGICDHISSVKTWKHETLNKLGFGTKIGLMQTVTKAMKTLYPDDEARELIVNSIERMVSSKWIKGEGEAV